MTVQIDSSLDGIDWARAKADALGFRRQPEFLSTVVGQWLDNDANR